MELLVCLGLENVNGEAIDGERTLVPTTMTLFLRVSSVLLYYDVTTFKPSHSLSDAVNAFGVRVTLDKL